LNYVDGGKGMLKDQWKGELTKRDFSKDGAGLWALEVDNTASCTAVK